MSLFFLARTFKVCYFIILFFLFISTFIYFFSFAFISYWEKYQSEIRWENRTNTKYLNQEDIIWRLVLQRGWKISKANRGQWGCPEISSIWKPLKFLELRQQRKEKCYQSLRIWDHQGTNPKESQRRSILPPSLFLPSTFLSVSTIMRTQRSHWGGKSGKCNWRRGGGGVSHPQGRRKLEEGTGRNLIFNRQMILLAGGRVDVLFILEHSFVDVYGDVQVSGLYPEYVLNIEGCSEVQR